MGPRILRERSSCSDPILATSGALAGCRIAKTEPLLFSFLSWTRSIGPFCPKGLVAKSWVDDVNFRQEGPRGAVVKSLAEAAMQFPAGVSADGLQLSDESAVIASDRVLAAELTSALKQAGLQ
eukprot:4424901-Pyramimonas_sp.AAC.1